VKYSYKGRYVEVVYEKEGSDLCVKVKSFGVPMPIKHGQEDLPFQLFWRGEDQLEYHNKKAIYHPGLGVGLWVSRQLAEASGGKVWLVPHAKTERTNQERKEEKVEADVDTCEGEQFDPNYSIFIVKFPLVAEFSLAIQGL